VAWFTLEQLGVLVRAHRADDSVTKAITRILSADLVVVDDIGLLPVGPDAAEGLCRLADVAYENRTWPSAQTCTAVRAGAFAIQPHGPPLRPGRAAGQRFTPNTRHTCASIRARA